MRFTIAGLCFTDAAGLPIGHDPWLVALSYVIAALGSYAALDMAERLRNSKRDGGALLWHLGSSAALGGGIWSMHFIAMLAFHTEVPVAYDAVTTAFSLLTAIAFVAIGIRLAGTGPSSPRRLVEAGLIVGIGVAAMHYTGMAALELQGSISYTPGIWALSILIAMVAAVVALWLALNPRGVAHRFLAALVMGVAICGMHYTGMESTVIELDLLAPPPGNGMSNGSLAAAVAGTTIGLLLLAMVSAAADRRLSAASEREANLLRRANAELEETRREIVRRLCSAGEFRDDVTGEHVARVGHLSCALALAAGCDADYANLLLDAAPLHDIGKIGIPDAVLLKPAALEPDEIAVMQRHTEIGHRLLAGSGMRLLDMAAEIALSHHEKWDGSGYPKRLQGADIPLSGRIVAIIDVFDALLSQRPYKASWNLESVRGHLQEEAGRHFDPELVRQFLGNLPSMLEIRNSFEPAQPRLEGAPAHAWPRPVAVAE